MSSVICDCWWCFKVVVFNVIEVGLLLGCSSNLERFSREIFRKTCPPHSELGKSREIIMGIKINLSFTVFVAGGQ